MQKELVIRYLLKRQLEAVNTGYLIEKLEMNPEYKLVSYEMPEQEQGHLSCTLGELFTGLELKLA